MRKGIRAFILSLVVSMCLANIAEAQTIYLKESFELGRKPDGWTEENVKDNVPWRYRNGGYNPSDPNLLTPPATYDMFRNPDKAYEGTYNAWFFTQGFGREMTKLVTPSMNLQFAVAPTLTFYLTLHEWRVPTGINNDVLRVYYRVGLTGAWRLIQTYNFVQNTWRDFQLALPSDALKSDVYLAFEGLSRWGMGVCLDKIAVTETGSQARHVTEVTTEANTVDFIPNGTANNPMLCSRVKVVGNTGDATLNSLIINAKGTSTTDISNVKIFATSEPYFNTSNQVATGTLTGSSITLNSTYSLPTGYTYLWVTYDVTADAKSGHWVDAEIPVNGLNVAGSLFPTAIVNSPGTRTIKQNLFFDDFETDKGWDLTGDFEIATPLGKVGLIGNPDPTYAVSGTKVLGNDLTHDGAYNANVPWASPYTATSPSFDAGFYKGLVLNFKSWTNVDLFDSIKVQASHDNGVTWKTLWFNNDYVIQDSWASTTYSFPSEFDRANDIKVRFTLASNGDREFTGWNIDDVAIIGNFMEKDLAVTGIVSPVSSCGNSTTGQPITIKVKNAGSKEAIAPIPVEISVNGTIINDNITQNIAPGAEATVTLASTMPTNKYGSLNVIVKTLLPADEDNSNDSFSKEVYISKTYETPYTNKFETSDDWVASGNEWEYGAPTTTNIQGETAGQKMWITSLNGNYTNGSTSYLTSPCFNIVGLTKPILEFRTNFITEDAKDGFRIAYSLDNGNTWQPLPDNGDQWDNHWKWNTQKNIAATGAKAFSGNSGGWINVDHLLPDALNGATGVKFKFEFNTDAANNIFEGVAIGAFSIKEAPDDFGVTDITYPVQLDGTSTCEGYTDEEKITFKLKNLGIKKAKAGTTIKISVKSDYRKTSGGSISRTEKFDEEFTLPADLDINQEVSYTTTKFINMDRGGYYNIEVKNTDTPDNFYENNNDAFAKVIYVKKPVVDLGTTVYLRDPDVPSHLFNISEYTSGFSYTVDWDTKKKGETSWTSSPGGGDTRTAAVGDFTSPNNLISYRVTLTDPVSGCKVSSIADVYKYNPDIMVKEVISPLDTCSLKDKQQVKVRFINNGLDIDTIKAGTTINLQLTVDGVTTTSHPYNVTEDIAPGKTFDFIFPEEFNMTATKSYSVKPKATMQYDVNTSNDILDATVTTFGYPNFELTPQDQVIEALSYTYDAGAGYSKYLWDNTTTNQTNTITYPGAADNKLWCSVTDNHGCSTKSEATYTFKVKDLGIKTINNITNACTQDPALKPNITIENKGNVTVTSGTSVPVDIIVNGTTTAGSFTLNADLAPNESRDVSLNDILDITAKNTYNIKLKVKYAGDLVDKNDTLSVIATTFGLPVSTLAPKVVTRDVEATLDAGAGFKEYLWSTTATSQEITVSQSGLYKVKITDSNGCSSMASSDVLFLKKDLAAEIISTYGTGNNVCTGTDEYPVTIRLSNVGNDTLHVGDVIPASFKFGETLVNENITLAEKLTPEKYVDYTFTSKITAPTAATTALSALINFNDENLLNNFSSIINIVINQTPTINLGDDVEVLQSTYTIVPIVVPDLPTNTYLWSNNATTKSITVSQGGNYQVTVNNKGCTATDDINIVLKKRDLRVVGISAPSDSCFTTDARAVTITIENSGYEVIPAGEQITLSYTQGTNTSSENITLATDLAIGGGITHTFAQKIPSIAAGTNSISATLSYALDGSASNNTTSRNLVVKPLPTVGLPAQIAVTGLQTTLSGPANMNTYLWSTGETSQNITVHNDGDYTLKVVDLAGCTNTGTTQVVFNPDIELVSITNAPYCQSNTPAPLILTVKNDGVNPIIAGTNITISGKIKGVDFTETYKFTEDLASLATRNITATNTLPIDATGTYNLDANLVITGEDNTSNNSKSVIVTVNPTPVVTLPATIDSQNSSETLTGPNGMTSYQWSNGATTQSITVTTSGAYTITVTNGVGCSASATSVVTFKAKFELTSINNSSYCQSNDAVPLAITVKNNSAVSIAAGKSLTIKGSINGTPFNEQYTFASSMDPASSLNITLSTTLPKNTVGQYPITVEVDYTDGAESTSDSKSKNIVINALPAISLPATIVSYDPSVTLSGPAGMTTYAWSSGETSQNITVTANGAYTLTATNANGCSASATSNVTFKAAIEPTAIKNTTFCQSETAAPLVVTIKNQSSSNIAAGTNINIKGTINGTPFTETYTLAAALASQQQQDITLATKLPVNVAGSYQASVEVVQGSFDNTSIAATINVDAQPVITLPATISSFNTSETLTGPNGMASYQWSTGETSQSITVTQDGTYTLTVTNAGGCKATASTAVSFTSGIELVGIANTTLCQSATDEALVVTIKNSSNTTLAAGTTITYKGDVNGTAFNEQHTIESDLAAQQSTNVTLTAMLPKAGAGTYNVNITVVVNGQKEFPANSKTVAINVNPSPSVSLPAEVVSNNTSETLTAPAGYTYEWSTGETTQSITVTQSGTYTLKVSNANGCSTTKSVVVNFKRGDIALVSIENKEMLCESTTPSPIVIKVSNVSESNIAKGETLTIAGTVNGSAINETYTLAEDLLAKAELTITLATTIPATPAGKTNTIALNVSYQYDSNHSNEAASKNVVVTANPSFNIDISTVADKSEATLSVSKSDLTYLWSNNATTRAITVYENGTYSVTATNANGCSLTKTTKVDYLVPKSSNYLMVYPVVRNTKCYAEGSTPFEATVVNESQSTTVAKGTNVAVSCTYQITKPDGKVDEYTFNETITLANDLLPNSAISIRFTNMTFQGKSSSNMLPETAGKQLVKGHTTINNLVSLEKSTQFEIFPLPSFDLGKETIYRSLPTVLKVNLSNDYTFLWSTGDKSNNIIVSTEGEYSVTVTSKNGCSSYDKVYVKEGSEDGSILLSVFPNPASTTTSVEAFGQNSEEMYLEIYTSAGVLVYSKTYTSTLQIIEHNIDVSRFETGNYVVLVRTKSKKAAKILIIGR